MWLKNLSLKLTALGLAVLLWLHVATDRVYDYPVELKLYAGPLPPQFVLARPLPDWVRVRMSGSGKELARFLWKDGQAEVRLEPWLNGVVPLSGDRLLVHVDANVSVAQVLDPVAVRVEVDTLVSRPVAVRLQGAFTLADGWALERSPKVEPDTVIVSGPRGRLQELDTLQTEPLDVGLLSAPAQLQVALDLDGHFNLHARPDSVQVVLDVAPIVRREFTGLAVTLPPGWAADPARVTVTVAGAGRRVNELQGDQFVVAPAGTPRLAHNSSVPLEASGPEWVETLAIAPARVRVFRP